MMLQSAHLRARDVRLACLTCGTGVTIGGPWNGPAIAGWTAAHRRPVVVGWTVELDNHHLAEVTRPVPPMVDVRGP